MLLYRSGGQAVPDLRGRAGSRGGPLRSDRRILCEQGVLRWADVHAGHGDLSAPVQYQRGLSFGMLFRRRQHRPRGLLDRLSLHFVLRKGGCELRQKRGLLHRSSLQWQHGCFRLGRLPAAMHQEQRLLHWLL